MNTVTPRHNSLLIRLSHKAVEVCFSDAKESDCLRAFGEDYVPMPSVASVYDFLRLGSTRVLVGIDVQSGSKQQRDILKSFSHFHESPSFPSDAGVVRLLFPDVRLSYDDKDIVSDWDQILSQNPFLSKTGSILIVLQIDHLADIDLARLALLCSTCLPAHAT
jgi:hypothetical protein